MSARAAAPDCRSTPVLLEERRDGRLGAARDRALTEHLAVCESCRDEAAATEPLPLFAALTSAPLPVDVEAYVLGGIRAVEARADRRRPLLARWWPQGVWWEPVPMLASLLLVGVLLVIWAVRGGGGEAAPGNGAGPMELRLEAHAMNNGLAALEDIRSPTAEVFTFSLAGETGPTEVIMIVDRSMDL